MRVTISTDAWALKDIVGLIHVAQEAGAPGDAHFGYDDDSGDFVISWSDE